MKYILLLLFFSFPFLSNSQNVIGFYNKELNLRDKQVFIECIAVYKVGNCIVIETENDRCSSYYITRNYIKNDGTIVYYLIRNSNKEKTILKVKNGFCKMYLENGNTNHECIFVLEGTCN